MTDEIRLESLARACGAENLATSFGARREGDAVVLTFGHCKWSQPVTPTDSPALGVIAGPFSVRVAREGGWTTDRRINATGLIVALVLMTLHAPILLAGLQEKAPVVLALIVVYTFIVAHTRVLTSGLVLLPALIAWLLVWVGAVLSISWQLTRPIRTTHFRRAVVGFAHVLIGAGVFASGLAVPQLARAAIGGPSVVDGNHVSAQCLLTGYSTAAGIDVVPQGADAFAALGARCPACNHAVGRHALPGHTFQEMHDYLVSNVGDGLSSTGALIFWGGGNDDLFWAMLSRRHVSSAIVLSAYVVEAILRFLDSGSLIHPTSMEFLAALDRAADRSAGLLDEQKSAIQSAVAAVRARRQRFVYAHDFFAYDMDSGRSPARTRLLEGRRMAVLAGGGEFVDLLEEARGEVGVAWFDDFIHPSAWGHEKLAEYLCRALTASH